MSLITTTREIVTGTLQNVGVIWEAIKGIEGLGKVGRYEGVHEVGFGFEGYRATQGTKPRYGRIGEDIFLGRATLTTYLPGEHSVEDLERIGEIIKSAHPWEHPVIEFSSLLAVCTASLVNAGGLAVFDSQFFTRVYSAQRYEFYESI